MDDRPGDGFDQRLRRSLSEHEQAAIARQLRAGAAAIQDLRAIAPEFVDEILRQFNFTGTDALYQMRRALEAVIAELERTAPATADQPSAGRVLPWDQERTDRMRGEGLYERHRVTYRLRDGGPGQIEGELQFRDADPVTLQAIYRAATQPQSPMQVLLLDDGRRLLFHVRSFEGLHGAFEISSGRFDTDPDRSKV